MGRVGGEGFVALEKPGGRVDRAKTKMDQTGIPIRPFPWMTSGSKWGKGVYIDRGCGEALFGVGGDLDRGT